MSRHRRRRWYRRRRTERKQLANTRAALEAFVHTWPGMAMAGAALYRYFTS